jgi:hypothetical protein
MVTDVEGHVNYHLPFLLPTYKIVEGGFWHHTSLRLGGSEREFGRELRLLQPTQGHVVIPTSPVQAAQPGTQVGSGDVATPNPS